MLNAKQNVFGQFNNRVVFQKRIALLILLTCTASYGQSDGLSGLVTCDEAVMRQDAVVAATLDRGQDNSFLIIVVRPGKSENSMQLASKRLFNVQQYFRLRGNRIGPEKLIFASGVPTKGLGQVEFYVNGQLVEVLSYPVNGFICHTCCGPDTDFYPEKSRSPKPRRRIR